MGGPPASAVEFPAVEFPVETGATVPHATKLETILVVGAAEGAAVVGEAEGAVVLVALVFVVFAAVVGAFVTVGAIGESSGTL